MYEEQPTDWADLTLHSPDRNIDSGGFYEQYHGHPLADLVRLRSALASEGCERFVFFLGDSSLDNKHWFFSLSRPKREQLEAAFTAPALNGFEAVLEPKRMVQDVSYWCNAFAERRLGRAKLCTIMSSVEASTISDRAGALLGQDAFVRDHVTAEDFVVCSIGGNDVALQPTRRTIANMGMLTRSPDWMIRQWIAPGFGYFRDLFGAKIEELVCRCTAKQRPKKVLICMLYNLDEVSGGSWADPVLSLLGYDTDPGKLQLVIKCLFHAIAARGFKRLERPVTGGLPCEVHAFPLFAVLNGKTTDDYCQRVEPSVQGGRKMAEALLGALLAEDTGAWIEALLQQSEAAADGVERRAAAEEATPGAAPVKKQEDCGCAIL